MLATWTQSLGAPSFAMRPSVAVAVGPPETRSRAGWVALFHTKRFGVHKGTTMTTEEETRQVQHMHMGPRSHKPIEIRPYRQGGSDPMRWG